ncbi:MAG: hypothetical protein AABZ53_08265 [Planctomycetota bacterium]
MIRLALAGLIDTPLLLLTIFAASPAIQSRTKRSDGFDLIITQ